MKKNSGFTMIELLMSITLIAVLSGIASTQYFDYRREAKIATTNKKLFEIREALVGNPEFIANGIYTKPGIIVDLGSVPTGLGDLISQGTYSSFGMYEKSGWRGPYIDSNIDNWSKDGWGTTISYGGAADRTLRSCGPDGICPNADDLVVTF